MADEQPSPRHVLYRQEFTKCGKATCKKCSAGPAHGPYWYAYQTLGGKTFKKYLGKDLPKTVTQHTDNTTISRASKAPNFWLIDRDADALGFVTQTQAELWAGKLKRESRIYEAKTRQEAWEQHEKFLLRWANNREAW